MKMLKDLENLLDEVDKRMTRAMNYFNQQVKEKGLRVTAWNVGGIEEVTEDGVETTWHRSYRYGDEEHGSQFYPAAVLDDTFWKDEIDRIISELAGKCEKENAEKKAREIAWKKEQLDKLKKELGED